MKHDERDLERQCVQLARRHGWDCVDITVLKNYHNLPDGCDIWDCREAAMRKETAR